MEGGSQQPLPIESDVTTLHGCLMCVWGLLYGIALTYLLVSYLRYFWSLGMHSFDRLDKAVIFMAVGSLVVDIVVLVVWQSAINPITNLYKLVFMLLIVYSLLQYVFSPQRSKQLIKWLLIKLLIINAISYFISGELLLRECFIIVEAVIAGLSLWHIRSIRQALQQQEEVRSGLLHRNELTAVIRSHLKLRQAYCILTSIGFAVFTVSILDLATTRRALGDLITVLAAEIVPVLAVLQVYTKKRKEMSEDLELSQNSEIIELTETIK